MVFRFGISSLRIYEAAELEVANCDFVTHSFEVPIWHFKIERAIKMADTEQTALTKANNDTQEISIESAESDIKA